MKKAISVIWSSVALSLLLINGCNSGSTLNIPTKEEIRYAFQAVLDSAIRPTFDGKIKYDIRGTFNYEYSDSLIHKSLACIDTILTGKDLHFIITQYVDLKGEELDPYIDINGFEVKEGATYVPEENIDYQFYLSPPLFTNNRQYFINYCIGTAIRPQSFTDGFFFLFINVDETWHLHSIIKNKYTTPDFVSSKQSHSYIPK